ncbi:MAG: hypothetical protein KDE15_13525 [Erythrobacter sp.]|nr:hypothetical protein [Erythrobacter sp.]
MSFGGPAFILAIIAMAMIAGVVKSWIRASHGLPEPERERGHRRRSRNRGDSDEVVQLKAENRLLTDRLEASEDRLAVLERIVTDRGYSLAEEIEALRDRPAGNGTTADSGVPLNFKDREEA